VHCNHFKTRNSQAIDMKIGYNNKLIPSFLSTKFLGLTINSTLSWRMHVDHLTTTISTPCNVIRSIKPLISHETLLLIYHTLFHKVRSYGIIFLANSCHSIQIFQMHKRVIRIIMGCGTRESCRILFKKLKILPLTSQYLLSLLIFVVNYTDKFFINSEIHNINTRQNSNFHLTSANLDIYQKVAYCSGSKVFNSLPFNVKKFSNNPRSFKTAVKQFLCMNYFYSLDKYYNNNSK